MIKKLDINYTINFLNSLIEADKDAIAKLLDARVSCNDELANHERVQVQETKDGCKIGVLGIINGLFGIHKESGNGYIAAVYDKRGNFYNFTRTPSTVEDE